MSLIQAALDKTQNRTSPIPEKKQVKVEAALHTPILTALGALDQEVEQKISELPQKTLVKKETESHTLLFIILLSVVLLTSGLMYWAQKALEREPAPPLVVDIERHSIPSKTKEEMAAINRKLATPTLLSPSDASGRFFLSGIAWGGAQPYAVINGQILRAGEMIEKKALLQSIERDRVTLDYRGEVIQLALAR